MSPQAPPGAGVTEPAGEGRVRGAGLASSLRAIAAARLALLITLFAALFVYFSLNVPNFLGAYNIYSVAQNGVIIGILGIGETLVIISGGGGIDLSVGSILSLSGMVLGIMNIEWRINIWLAVAGCILTGLVLGCLNGVLVSVVRIPPLIVTLATFYGYAAIALQLTNTRPLPDATQPDLPQSFPPEFITIGNGNIQDIGWLSWFPKISGEGIPFQVFFVFLPLTILTAFVLRRTVSGRYLYGVGVNALAARFSAIDVWGVRFCAYAAAGLLAGMAAVVQTALSASATPNVGEGLNLQAITIAVLGGVSITGGEGGVLGVILSTLIVIFLYNGLGLQLGNNAGVWQPFALGVLLIGSVVFNEWVRRRLSVA
jgi:ribose/xylose/arabinose/galactoside ABC-type transport system permease subunit